MRRQVERLAPGAAAGGGEGDAAWVVLDGAHTPGSARALAATLAGAFPGRPLAAVVAMADDKDHQGFLAELRAAGPQVVVFTSAPVAGASDRRA